MTQEKLLHMMDKVNTIEHSYFDIIYAIGLLVFFDA